MTKDEILEKWKTEHPEEYKKLIKLPKNREAQQKREENRKYKMKERLIIMVALWMKGYTHSEIAIVFNLSQQRVCQLLKGSNK